MTPRRTTPAPERHCKRWTVEEDAHLAHLVTQAASNKVIASHLGRTVATINGRKNKRGLVSPRPQQCECGAPIRQAPTGRPARYCPPCVGRVSAAAVEERRDARVIARAKADAERLDRYCAGDNCTALLPRDRPALRFCSRECSRRTHEAHYQRPQKRPSA